jgi:glutathione S-transferase
MVEAETSVRTLHAYAGVFQGRLALARASGRRREFEAVSESALRRAATLCDQATAAIESALASMSPELASHAASVADIICQREFDLPPGAAPALHVVAADDRSA